MQMTLKHFSDCLFYFCSTYAGAWSRNNPDSIIYIYLFVYCLSVELGSFHDAISVCCNCSDQRLQLSQYTSQCMAYRSSRPARIWMPPNSVSCCATLYNKLDSYNSSWTKTGNKQHRWMPLVYQTNCPTFTRMDLMHWSSGIYNLS